MIGFDGKGNPTEYDGDFLETCKQQKVPYSKSKRTYKEAVVEALPNLSMTQINRLFKDGAVTVHGYKCEPDENPDELFGGSFVSAVMRVGKTRVILFR